MSRIRRSVFSAVAALGLGASGASAETELTLGMVVATTGPLAGAEASLVNGVKLAVEDVNAKGGVSGGKIKLLIEDTGSEQTGAVNAYNRILARKPAAIMNTTISGFVLSQLSVIREEGVATFTGASTAQIALDRRGVPNLLRIRTADSRVPAAATRFVLGTLGAKRIAVLRANTEYGLGWAAAIEATLSANGLKAALVESMEVSDRDVTAQLLRIKNAAVDVLIVVGDPPQHAVIVKQIRQLGLTMKIVLSNSAILPSTLRLYPAGAADGMYGMTDSLPAGDPAQKEWAERYRKMFGIDPDASAAEYYDGVIMFAEAVAKAGSAPEAVAKALRNLKEHVGVGNTYTFADRGDGGRSLAIVMIKDGKLELVANVQ